MITKNPKTLFLRRTPQEPSISSPTPCGASLPSPQIRRGTLRLTQFFFFFFLCFDGYCATPIPNPCSLFRTPFCHLLPSDRRLLPPQLRCATPASGSRTAPRGGGVKCEAGDTAVEGQVSISLRKVVQFLLLLGLICCFGPV